MGSANCTISIPNFGALRVKALKVVHGMSVVAYNGSGVSRSSEAFYPSKRTSGSFELDLVFSTYKGYERTMLLFQTYMQWAGNPRALASPVRVQIPDFDFDKTGALESGVEFGDSVGMITYKATLGFVGAREPLAMKKAPYTSRFVDSKSDDPATRYFYPAGTQLSGAQNGWDTVYDPGGVTGNGADGAADLVEGVLISSPPIKLPDWW